MLLLNPVVVSVIVMIGLCLAHLNVIFALIAAALAAGIAAHQPLAHVMGTLIGGMGGNSEMALSYLLLGALAIAINKTGAATVACQKIGKMVKGSKITLALLLAFLGCLSGTVIPIHIAFIPIIVPPLLALMNKLEADRRQMACALTYGLFSMYPCIPVGYGIIFMGIVANAMSANGMAMEWQYVWRYTWILEVGMVLALFASLWYYRKPRHYEDRPVIGIGEASLKEKGSFSRQHIVTGVSVLVAFGIQLFYESLPLGAFAALACMVVFRAIQWHELEETLTGSIQIMGLISFVMLVASGYGSVIQDTKGVDMLVNAVVQVVGGSKVWGGLLMLFVGLLVTMGIGTSFGTIPIIAVIYCPLAMKLGFSVGATACLIVAAGALGDAGSPASDTTLGPTAGLNADGQHDHIWDTCVPSFLFFNTPLFIFAMIGALWLY